MDHGITAINLHSTPAGTFINGQHVLTEGTFNYADGTSGMFVEVALDTATDDGRAIMVDGDGALLPLSGVINNTGTIALDSTGHATTLELIQHGVTDVTFVGADDFGTLVLDNPTAYTGQIFGFTGTGPENSDIIDLKGITFDGWDVMDLLR